MIGHFANELALSRGPTPYPFLMTVWHEIFRVLILAIFAVFPAIRKNKFPQIKITANFFPAKIYSRVTIL